MLAQVPDQGPDVVRMSCPMAPLEYTLTTTRPAGSTTKLVNCRKRGSGLANVPFAWAMAAASVLWPTGNRRSCLGDQVPRCGFVVDRHRDDL